MARPKIARKSTAIDMTAMCDVAFLLLSFFILTAKPKGEEAIRITTPSSVASKVAPEKNVVMISMDSSGKVFLSMDDKEKKRNIAQLIKAQKGLNFDENEFVKAEFFGTSFAQIPQYLTMPVEDRKGNTLPGIPVDSTKGSNELIEWMQYVATAYQNAGPNEKMNLLLKGDNNAKYPSFKAVITAFKKNNFLKFQMVTNPEGIPAGSELAKNPPKKEE
jgi:biopolymer transport protein ExbD